MSGTMLDGDSEVANVALRLGSDLGSKATIVSISVDPEHDVAVFVDCARVTGNAVPSSPSLFFNS